ncbi:hypothetical protein DFS34DRAFT_652401 [Phlyctochytrium arcticum]|nr:hypothetical protein DFS34DRAFT_652401 [Phlyctochytrium arcticum]
MSRRSRIIILLALVVSFMLFLTSLQPEEIARGSQGTADALKKLVPTRNLKTEKPIDSPAPAPVEPPPVVVAGGVAPSERGNTFSDIYKLNSWGDSESLSGPGSTVNNTVRVRQLIDTAIRAMNIKTFLDAPCGDCNWQPNLDTFNRIQYTGADIVERAITLNMRKYLNKPNMRFVNLDLVLDKIPKNHFDAVLCRDAIQHLPLKDGLQVYKNFEQSGAKYLITNFHDPKFGGNQDIAAGQFYHNHPFLPPFNFSKPLFYTIDASDQHLQEVLNERKYIAVWKLPVVGRGDGNAFVPDEELAKKGIVPVSEEGRQILLSLRA